MNNLSFEQNLTPEQKIQICEHLATVVMGYLSTTMGNPNHCAIWWYSHSGETIPKSRWNPLENANQISLCLKHFHYYQHFKTPETVSILCWNIMTCMYVNGLT